MEGASEHFRRYVGRPTKWGNPFFALAVKDLRKEAVSVYKRYVEGNGGVEIYGYPLKKTSKNGGAETSLVGVLSTKCATQMCYWSWPVDEE